MKRPISMLRKLRQDRGGVVAVLVALAMPVLVGSAALTIDISYFRHVQGLLQSAADSGALAGIAKLDQPTSVAGEAINYTKRNVPENFGDITTAGDVQIGIWDADSKTFTPSNSKDVNAVRVTARRDEARGNGMTTILLQYFDQDAPNVAATATAARHLIVQYEPPEKTDLDNEAHDYNRLYAYCFNYSGTGPASNRRSQMTLISDNVPKSGSNIDNFWTQAGTRGFGKVPSSFVWPECAKGESLSFRLENIRVVKQNPNDTTITNKNWSNFDKNPSGNTFNHHTDTVIASGVETFPGLTQNILETVRCDTSNQCEPGKPGSLIKTGKNRTPDVSGQPCMPGKFMYFGWEDRPPTNGDRDYDDIRILMRCPKTGRLGDGISRLVG